MSSSDGGPPQHKKQKRGNGPHLNAFFKSYKGLDDVHLPIFRAFSELLHQKHHASDQDSIIIKVLYPGCHRHITASLVFPSVTYVDSDAKVCELYKDERAMDWVKTNKEYQGESEIVVIKANFKHKIPGLFRNDDSFDALISASAGIVSVPCERYLKTGGYLLVSDAHYDARKVFTSYKFRLVAAWDEEKKEFSHENLKDYFHVVSKGRAKDKKNPEPISKEQVQQSIDLPKSKRPFKMVKEGMFFIFEKV